MNSSKPAQQDEPATLSSVRGFQWLGICVLVFLLTSLIMMITAVALPTWLTGIMRTVVGIGPDGNIISMNQLNTQAQQNAYGYSGSPGSSILQSPVLPWNSGIGTGTAVTGWSQTVQTVTWVNVTFNMQFGVFKSCGGIGARGEPINDCDTSINALILYCRDAQPEVTATGAMVLCSIIFIFIAMLLYAVAMVKDILYCYGFGVFAHIIGFCCVLVAVIIFAVGPATKTYTCEGFKAPRGDRFLCDGCRVDAGYILIAVACGLIFFVLCAAFGSCFLMSKDRDDQYPIIKTSTDYEMDTVIGPSGYYAGDPYGAQIPPGLLSMASYNSYPPLADRPPSLMGSRFAQPSYRSPSVLEDRLPPYLGLRDNISSGRDFFAGNPREGLGGNPREGLGGSLREGLGANPWMSPSRLPLVGREGPRSSFGLELKAEPRPLPREPATPARSPYPHARRSEID